MDKNIKIAKQLVRIAKMLVSEDTSFNPSSSNAGDDIESMSKDEKINLAKNKNTSPEILEKLAEDGDVNVRYEVTRNPKAPVNILIKLAEDKDKLVIYAVAENPNTPAEVLKKLAEDRDWFIRWEVASNPNTPVEALRKLAKNDSSGGVIEAAERALRKRGL